MLNPAGEAIFKVVAVSYTGAGGWVHKVRDLIRPERRGSEPQVIEHDAWRYTMFDFLLDEARVQGRPVRIHVYGHEGIGFIGQPGSAKDVVYKNAHAIIALARGNDVRSLVAVVDADLQRLQSQHNAPVYVLAAFPGGKLETPVKGGTALNVDWDVKPLDPLQLALDGILLRYR